MLRDISLSVPAKYPSINEIYCVYVCFHGAPFYKRDEKTSLNRSERPINFCSQRAGYTVARLFFWHQHPDDRVVFMKHEMLQ